MQQALKNYTNNVNNINKDEKEQDTPSGSVVTPLGKVTEQQQPPARHKPPGGNDVVLPEVPHRYKNPRYFRQAILDCLPLYAGSTHAKKRKLVQQILTEVPKRGGRLLIPPAWTQEDLVRYCQASLGQLLHNVLSHKNNKKNNQQQDDQDEAMEICLPESRKRPHPAFVQALLSGCIYDYAAASGTAPQDAIVTALYRTLRRRGYTFLVPQGWGDAAIQQSLHRALQARCKVRGLTWAADNKTKKKQDARFVSPTESPVATVSCSIPPPQTLQLPEPPPSAPKRRAPPAPYRPPPPAVCYRPYSAAIASGPWMPPPLATNAKPRAAVGAYSELLRAADDKRPKKRRRTDQQPRAVPSAPYPPPYAAYHPPPSAPWMYPPMPYSSVVRPEDARSSSSNNSPIQPPVSASSLQTLLHAAATVDVPERAFDTRHV